MTCNECIGCEYSRSIEAVNGSCGFDENNRAEFNGDVEVVEYCSEMNCVKKVGEQ